MQAETEGGMTSAAMHQNGAGGVVWSEHYDCGCRLDVLILTEKGGEKRN